MSAREFVIQRSIIQGLRTVLRPPARVFWVPNGSFLKNPSPAQLKVNVASGLWPGCPDLQVIWRGSTSSPPRVGFIEVKSATGKLRAPQEEWRYWCEGAGIPCGVARSLDDAVDLVTEWGVPFRPGVRIGRAAS